MRAGEYLRLYAMCVDGEMLITLNKSLINLINRCSMFSFSAVGFQV